MRSLSRKEFIIKSGTLLGGAYTSLLALDLLKAAPVHRFDLSETHDAKHVLILGAGLTGLTAAYELQKLGYHCTILEARNRIGGRCWSVRNGSSNEETDLGSHTASFDDGLYFNAGPSRIPHHHDLTLHYCKTLNVPLEIYNNINEAAYFFSEGEGPLSNQKIRAREIHNDVRGHMAELLAKAVDQQALNLSMSPQDVEKFIQYLRAEGGLDVDKLYKASARRGYKTSPGTEPGEVSEAYRLSEYLSSGLMEPDFYNVAEYTLELQMTMFQAVGGMDRIAQALGEQVHADIHLGAEVSSIKNSEDGVTVTYSKPEGESQIEADFCICTIPLSVLTYLDHNFSGNVTRAIDYSSYNTTGKIGLQFKRRFWEEDEGIYGGITRTNNDLTQIFYPSNDYQSKKGILIGSYHFGDSADRIGRLSYPEREQFALEKGRMIHPQYSDEFESSFSVSWHKTKFNLGGWAEYNSQTRETIYKVLQEPERNVYFAGEHMTYLNAWMAGAFESARSVVGKIHSRVNEQHFEYPKTSG
ncbi:flavin monoamine oxidase family protein [Rhodohalobacter sp. 614A]|uniref:flavin monoamine oxidase family protein n=1 Tax=Rhodohalobacter sp. 614A TaxID=2908649 RepID=UPI001F337A26|nr:flavin monoamine oxidase family protein [Rhodohalobacter sp. 614A]